MAPVTTQLTSSRAPSTVSLGGWGGGGEVQAQLLRPEDPDALRAGLDRARGAHGVHGVHGVRGAIARGMGRSYGDAAQLAGGLVLDLTALKHVDLDPQSGIVTAQAGITIGELLDQVVPRGWIVPVVPGTQHVTIGGAIASDIHGKNHGTAGTFGSHVRAIGLLTAGGDLLELEPDDPEGLFAATLGGMGLTGIIVWARIALAPAGRAMLSVDTDRARDLDEALALLSQPGGPHRVAWLDVLGPRAGRGIVTRAELVGDGDALPGSGALAAPTQAEGPTATVRPRATVPARWPSSVLRPSTVMAFNELRFRRAPRRERGHLEQFGAHMFPLDVLRAWPRLYGPRGFVQYQLVVPPAGVPVLQETIGLLRRRRVPCYLAVLKDFGPANGAPLSFPIEGWTLALDLPGGAPGLQQALQQLDELVAAAGGRVYLSKDSRLRPDTVRAMYPELPAWQRVRDQIDPDGLWRSDLALRTGLVQA
jgi:decaprenylphospho-beta-D-ribofuranose 2-oxidase